MGQHRKGSDTAIKDHLINKQGSTEVPLIERLPTLHFFPSYLHLAPHQINHEATAKALMKQDYLCDFNRTS